MGKMVAFPSDIPLSSGIKYFIARLLDKNPRKRLGHMGGIK